MASFRKESCCSDCNLKMNMFCFLSDEQLKKVDKTRFEVEFNNDEVIFKQGGPLTHIVCITKGLAKIRLEDESN